MNHISPRILLVDDEEGIRFALGALLKKEGYLVEGAACIREAKALLSAVNFDLVLCDILLNSESGIDLLTDIKAAWPAIQVIMFTGRPELETAIRAVRQGAFDYLTKPVKYDNLSSVIRLALSHKQIREQAERYRADLDAIFRSIADAVIMIDTAGKLVRYNEAAHTICGYGDQQCDKEIATMETGCEGTCRDVIITSLQEGKPSIVRRMECRRRTGKQRIVSLTVTPVADADQVVQGVVAVVRDETRLVQLEQSLSQREQFHGILGNHPSMHRVFAMIEALADLPTTVLINGESGTGKELVAAALHHGGCRSNAPYIKVNCSALSESLLESELFGHVRGAFTGAIADKKGRFERAHGGTIFLDEIGDISPAMQMRLLRVLQEMVVERVGDATPISIDVRVVTATNQNLEEKVQQGLFRRDLYYRLNVVKIKLPPLCERRDDIPLLMDHFLSHFTTRFDRTVSGFSDAVRSIFMRHSWPGNVRELEHAVEHACILCQTATIQSDDLPSELLHNQSPKSQLSLPQETPPHTLHDALILCNGNKSLAAKMLGISRRTVYRHLGE